MAINPTPFTGADNLLTETFEGSPAGMNLAIPQQELADTEARYIQDALVDYPGLVRRRGPIVFPAGIATLTRKATGFTMTLNPQGVDKYGILNGDVSNGYFSVLSDDLATVQSDLAWPHPLPTTAGAAATAYRVTDSKPALMGGVWIGVSSSYNAASPTQGLALWRGANRANYTTGSITVARGSAAVVGVTTAWLTNAAPGMFLFANTDDPYTSAYIGTILSINSDTSITLEAVSPYPITGKTYTLQSLRGFAPKVLKGRITCDTTGATVTGGATEFNSQGLGTGSWNVYRQSDLAWVGKVLSIQSDTALTLAASAAVACSNEAYVALRADADFSIQTTGNINKVGFINAVYANRQWFANNGANAEKTTRVWFSDTTDPEGVDLSSYAGDWLDIPSSSAINAPIQAIASSQNALLVFKENETFAVYGSVPSQFAVKKLEDDGALSGMSVQAWGSGVIWAGREGIHFFDGIQSTNLTQNKLGDYWKNTIRTFDPSKYRMWSMINRDHYMLFIENIAPTVAVVKGNIANTPTRYTITINMATQAITIMTNLNIRGSIVLPATAGKKMWYIVNDATKGYICDGEALFNQEGNDAIACDSGTAGPDFFYESKKFNAGDALRLKRFKQLALHYEAQGDYIVVDSVVGLNNIGQTLTSNFPASILTWDALRVILATWDALKTQNPTWASIIQAVFVPKRVKFQKKSQHLSFRLYQHSSAITRLQMGPFSIAYKLMRKGRVN